MAAGLAVTVVNQTLCDCFLDFGQVIAEVTMLLAFVLFGALLPTLLADVPLLATLLLAVLAILVIRPVAVRLVLRLGRAGLQPASSTRLENLVVEAVRRQRCACSCWPPTRLTACEGSRHRHRWTRARLTGIGAR